MMDALQRLCEVTFTWEDGGATLLVQRPSAEGAPEAAGPVWRVPDRPLYLGNAGTAARFLTAVATLAVDARQPGAPIVLTGNARMQERPIRPLVDALCANGARVPHPPTFFCSESVCRRLAPQVRPPVGRT
jgi:pentafunctional AROM polypeptide